MKPILLFFSGLLLSLSALAQSPVRHSTSTDLDASQTLLKRAISDSVKTKPSLSQVQKLVADSATKNTQTFSSRFVKNGSGQIDIADGITATVSTSVVAGDPNPPSGDAVQKAVAGRAAAVHNHVASDVQDFSAAVWNVLKAYPGFGAGTVLSAAGTWVSATGGAQLTQLAAPVLTTGTVNGFSVQLNWTSPPNSATFVLEGAADPQFSNGLYTIYTGTANTYTIFSLPSGTSYYYRITALNTGYANSNYGFATATTTGTQAGQLSQPTVTAGASTTSTLAFSWGAVSGATSYSVTYATNAGLTANPVSLTTTATSYTATGLQPGTTYYLSVIAKAAGSTDSPAGTTTGITSATGTSTTALGATSLTFTGTSSSATTASWVAVGNAASYQLDRATDNGFTTGLVSTTGLSGTSTTITGLLPATLYYFRIKAIAATGSNYTDGIYSTVASVTTSSTAVSTTALAQTTNLNANGVMTTAINAAWVPVTNASGYQIDISTSSTFATITNTISTTNAYAQFTGLTPGTVYYLRVKATGTGSYTDGSYSTTLSRTTTAAVAGTYAVAKTVRVNYATSSNSGAVTGWNTLAPANASITTGYTSSALLASDGSATGFSLSIVAGFSGGNVTLFGATPPAQNGVWPDLVLNRGWSFPNATSTIRISGLDPAKTYHLFVLGAAPTGSAAGYISVTATGSAAQTSGLKYLPGNIGVGSASDTDSPALVNVYNITPNAGGYIDYSMGRFSGNNSSWQTQGFILQEANIPK